MAASSMSASHSGATYSDCVGALRNSLSFLESSVSTLDAGVQDFPRLVGVLKTVRHYELIPQPTLAAAEASLQNEIGPAISTLLDRADAHIARADRRIDALKARSELQQGRLAGRHIAADEPGHGRPLSRGNSSNNRRFGKSPSSAAASAGSKRLNDDAQLRARVIRQRRDALQYSVERLELEVQQKERELRKRLDSAS